MKQFLILSYLFEKKQLLFKRHKADREIDFKHLTFKCDLEHGIVTWSAHPVIMVLFRNILSHSTVSVEKIYL